MPRNDSAEGQRAFAQAADHLVPAGLDALGDRDFAFTRQQFDRTHFAQVHAHRVIGAAQAFGIDVTGGRFLALAFFLGGVVALGFGGGRGFGFVVVLVLDNLHAHFRQGRHHVLDLFGGHLVLWQDGVEFVESDVTAFLAAGDQFLDGAGPGVQQGRIVILIPRSRVRTRGCLCRHARSIPTQQIRLRKRAHPARAQWPFPFPPAGM